MGALIRRLEGRVRHDKTLLQADEDDVLNEIEDAIVSLCVLHFRVQRLAQR